MFKIAPTRFVLACLLKVAQYVLATPHTHIHSPFSVPKSPEVASSGTAGGGCSQSLFSCGPNQGKSGFPAGTAFQRKLFQVLFLQPCAAFAQRAFWNLTSLQIFLGLGEMQLHCILLKLMVSEFLHVSVIHSGRDMGHSQPPPMVCGPQQRLLQKAGGRCIQLAQVRLLSGLYWDVLAVGIKKIGSHHSTVGFIKCQMHPLFTLFVLTKTQLHWDILSWSLVDLQSPV